MSLRHHEIAESEHRILNPLTEEKLRTLTEAVRPHSGQRHLDLACGKGELLVRWAHDHGTSGTGVDISKAFLDAARERAAELGVTERLSFERGDAAAHVVAPGSCELVSSLGATWIGGGLTGTLDLMRPALAPGGLMVVGETYWISEPSPDACEMLGTDRDDFADLAGTNGRFEAAGFELIEMVLADRDSRDRYVASQWRTISDWLLANPDSPDADDMRLFLRQLREAHLVHGRDLLGWGAFVLRPVR